jgi:ABC-type thiamin/hydroxymethylpyrimidine transport system permease subunit
LDKWYGKLLTLLVVFAVIYVVFSIIGGIFALLMPFIGPLFLIWLIVTIIRNSNRRW